MFPVDKQKNLWGIKAAKMEDKACLWRVVGKCLDIDGGIVYNYAWIDKVTIY